MQEGLVFTFYKDPYCKIPVFLMGAEAGRCILWIGSQAESFLNFSYFPKLLEMLRGNWGFAQMELPSSRIGFGAQDHVHDAEDVDDLISILLREHAMREIALFATGTAVQVAFELLENGRHVEFITRVILYGVVCDPESPLFTLEADAARKKFVAQLIADGRHEDSRALVDHYDIPITPARLFGGGYPTLQEAVWCPCIRNDLDALRQSIGIVKVPLLVMLAHHAQYKPAQQEINTVMRLVGETAGSTHVTVSYFNDTCDERRRVLKAADDEHVSAIVHFLSDEDEKRAEFQEKQRFKAIEDERKRNSVLQATAFSNKAVKASTV